MSRPNDRTVRWPASRTRSPATETHPAPRSQPMTRCAGCGRTPPPARASCLHDGSAVGFCCAGCKGKFLAAPGRYLHANDPVCGALVDRVRPGANGAPRRAPVLALRRCLPRAVRSRADDIRRSPGARRRRGSRSRIGPAPPGRLHLPLPPRSAERHHRGLPRVRHGAGATDARSSGAHRVRLSHAPGRGARCAGKLPRVRHGAGAAGGATGRRAEPGACRHAPPARRRPVS